MASVELGGYELRYDTGSVYVTKNFFALLGAPEVDGSSLTVRTFGELLEHIQLARPCTVNAEGDKVLTVVQGGRTRYIMLRVTTEDRVQVGLAEDVTAATGAPAHRAGARLRRPHRPVQPAGIPPRES